LAIVNSSESKSLVEPGAAMKTEFVSWRTRTDSLRDPQGSRARKRSCAPFDGAGGTETKMDSQDKILEGNNGSRYTLPSDLCPSKSVTSMVGGI
jgi:hypothetical protein